MVSKSKLEWLVIHSTETEFGLSTSLSEINSNHKERFGIIGFSDVIDFEGSIKATYDFYDYKKTKPYDWGLKNSRHIAYVGGLSEDGFYKEDTKSPEQQETLEVYIAYMKKRHPNLKVINSSELKCIKKDMIMDTL